MANRNRQNRQRTNQQHLSTDRPYQQARREAEKTSRHETIRFYDHEFTIHEDTFKDTEFIENMLILEDPNATEASKAASGIKVARLLAGTQWDHLMTLTRAHNDGIADIEQTMKFVRQAVQAIAPEQHTS